jgi:hypothetical protein
MFIKKYHQFINESRSKVLDLDKSPEDVIKQYAPWYLEHPMEGVALYRGLDNDAKYMLIDPRGHYRKPIGEDSSFEGPVPLYYDLMMNESKRWRKFCGDIRRDESIFCTNDEMKADYYGVDVGGHTYRLIPLKEDTEFILGFTPDTYGSFTYIDHRFGIDMSYFSREVKKYLGLSTWDFNTLNDMRKEVESIYKEGNIITDNHGREMTHTQELLNWLNKKNSITGRAYEDRILIEEIEKEGGLMNWLEKMFDPELNQFDKVKYNSDIYFDRDNKYNGRNYKQFELWTNKPCLLVRNDLLKRD